MKKQSFLYASLLLTCSALFAKVCGALFKLPLTSMLGGTGMGYFSCAYGLFLPLYAVLVTGLSTAVARPVADFAGQKQFASACRVRHVARILCTVTGLAGFGMALICARPFTLRTSGSLEAFPAVLAITPSVLLCCLTAVERGYYEGLCSMTPTAISQAAEAVGKLVAGLYFCRLFLLHIPVFPGYSRESMGALGAVLGVTISTAIGYLCMCVRNLMQPKRSREPESPVPSDRELLHRLVCMMLPAALGALVTNLTSLIDLMTVMQCFRKMLAADSVQFYQNAALSPEIPLQEASAFVYGSFMGLSVTVFNLVPSLTNMLSRSVLPCTAQAWAAGDRNAAAAYARQVFVLTGLVAVPAGCGIFTLAEPILQFLFSGRDAEIQAATAGLRWLAPAMVFLCLSFPAFSLLQAIGKERLPVKIMLPGVFLKLCCNILLIPRFCTAGAAIATSICYGCIFLLSVICLNRQLQTACYPLRAFLAQCLGGVLCAGAAWVCYDRLSCCLSQKVAFLLAVCCAVLVYLLVICLTARQQLMLFIPDRFPAARGSGRAAAVLHCDSRDAGGQHFLHGK